MTAFKQACQILCLEGSRQERALWDEASCDDLDPGLALVCFDAARQHGAGQAARWLEFVLGVTVDGAIGPADPLEAVAAFHALRLREETHADE